MKKISVYDILKLYDSPIAKIYLFLRNLLLPHHSIEKFIPKKGVFYDVGCGFGSYSIFFALSSKKRKLIGLELNNKRVAAARNASKNILNVDFKHRDLRKNAELKKADGIILIDLLHHVPYETQISIFNECKKHLKNNGVIIVKEIAKKPLWKYLYNYVQDKVMTLNDHLFFRTPEEYKTILVRTGFKIVEEPKMLKTWPLNPIPHYIMMAKNEKNNQR